MLAATVVPGVVSGVVPGVVPEAGASLRPPVPHPAITDNAISRNMFIFSAENNFLIAVSLGTQPNLF
jgi:hypothetical protein